MIKWEEWMPQKESRYSQNQAKMLKRFGITYRQYIGMLSEQGNKCAICEQKPKPFRELLVDCNLKTQKARALVCRKCSILLGLVNDSPKVLQGYINYLLKHGIEGGVSGG